MKFTSVQSCNGRICKHSMQILPLPHLQHNKFHFYNMFAICPPVICCIHNRPRLRNISKLFQLINDLSNVSLDIEHHNNVYHIYKMTNMSYSNC